MLDIVDTDLEKKYKTEDNFFFFLGCKGSSINDRVRFLTVNFSNLLK